MAEHGNGSSGSGKPRHGQGDSGMTLADRVRMLETLLNSTPALIAYWDKDLRCQFGNVAFATWFDSTSLDVVGLDISTFLDKKALAAIEPFIAGVLSGARQTVELPLVRADGARVQTLTHYTPDFHNGAVIGFTTHSTDVGGIKETEATLRAEVAERQRANRIIRASSTALEEAQRLGQIGSWTWTKSTDLVTWSKELYRIMGRPPTGSAPPYAEQGALYAPESWQRLQASVEYALRTGEAYQVRLQYLRRDGDTGWLDARGEVIRGAGGEVSGLRGTVQVVPGRRSDRQRADDKDPTIGD